MHSSQSVLRTIVERIRTYLDEPDADAKYTDDYMVRHVLYPSLLDVFARLSLTSGCPVILTADLTESTLPQARRLLPPCVLQVTRLVINDTNARPVLDIQPRNVYDRSGPGWRIEGAPGAQSLILDEPMASLSTVTVWYIPSGDAQAHLASGVLADNSGVDRVSLSSTPTLGGLDRRPNAYAGSVLRILPSDDATPTEERQITRSYLSSGTWYADVVRPFSLIPDGAVTYEIAPPASQAMCECVAARAAGRLGVGRKITQAHDARITREYLMALKTVGDNLTHMQGRTYDSIARNTLDSPSPAFVLPPTTF